MNSLYRGAGCMMLSLTGDGRSNQGASAQKEETSKGVVAEWREMPLKKYMILGIKSLEKRRPSKWQLCHG